MSDAMPGLPAPLPDATTRGYWNAAASGEFVIQRCTECGTDRHPPTEVCYSCGALDWAWRTHTGNGSVYSYTWADRPVVPALAALGVYNVSVVELHDTIGVVRILSRVTDIERHELRIGLEVEVHFDSASADTALPVFRPRQQEVSS
ncbi:Zn-ribbon domain-containing OB-fold protein [Mycobacterium avium]|uniref:DNA-binding protein n=1 Tax=Mycobacterium avium (strain 104) TaxID=243243 RepID=A0A0H2ZWE4_MYCA1|nr:zinc ribbon domain-containing protein [Mycobacterium avium]ABK66889.1 conserved hypothetical protein [Mycobacterium avium 104]KDP08954.1 hypothetical protein MAV101_02430 [Mycobacterium avium subsp. hominissuis 101]MCG3242821.1 OB-fold domain-containing protein [Mycobacterium avium subsp. hominissuis]